MTELILAQNQSETMTSLEIAELTGKRHSDVIRDIKTTLEQADLGERNFASTYLDSQNKERPIYNLPKFECDLVVSGYSVKYRAAIIKRWHELEAAKPEKTRLELARDFVALLEEQEATKLKLSHIEIQLDESLQWSTIKRMEAKTGKKYSWRKLKATGIERKDIFDANYGTVKSYHASAWLEVYGIII